MKRDLGTLRSSEFHRVYLVAQLLTSAVIDQFGLFSMAKRPIDTTKAIELVVIVAGIAIIEIGV